MELTRESVQRMERYFGSLREGVLLPRAAGPRQVEARLQDGVPLGEDPKAGAALRSEVEMSERRRMAQARSLRGPRAVHGRLGGGGEEGLQAPRPQVPPRSQPRGQSGRGALQGDQRGLRGPLRPREEEAYDTYGTAGPEPPRPRPDVHFEGFDFGAGPDCTGASRTSSRPSSTRPRPQASGPQPRRGPDLPRHPLAAGGFPGQEGAALRPPHRPLRRCGGRGARSPLRGSGPAPGAPAAGRVGSPGAPSLSPGTCDLCGGTGQDPGDPCTDVRRDRVSRRSRERWT